MYNKKQVILNDTVHEVFLTQGFLNTHSDSGYSYGKNCFVHLELNFAQQKIHFQMVVLYPLGLHLCRIHRVAPIISCFLHVLFGCFPFWVPTCFPEVNWPMYDPVSG